MRIAVAVAVLAGTAAWFFVLGPPPAPGFIRDEASVAYNAYTLSHNLRDQNGGLLPLYIKSFGDYKSPLFPYVLAAVFRVTGPSRHVALDTAAALVYLAVAALGFLAWRRTRSLFVVCAVVVLGALTPWLYELGRTSYETIIEPLVLAFVVLAVDWASRSNRRPFARALPVGLSLGALMYSYAAGRILAPLLVVALVLVFRRDRRWVAESCGIYALTLLPLAVYSAVHKGALSARFDSTTYLRHGMSPATIVYDFFRNYVTDANLEHWVVSGDPTPYIHVHGAPQLYGSLVALAAVGVVIVWRRHRDDRFWWFVVLALVLSPVASAVTDQRYYSLRLLALPMLLLVLAIPALDSIGRGALRDRRIQVVAAVLAIGVGAQFWQWRHNYYFNNNGRTVLFEGHLPPLLQRAFAGGRTVYVDHADVYAQTHALWYAVTHDISTSHVSILAQSGHPPAGSIQFGRLSACAGPCTRLGDADTYWIARTIR